ncbi:hypothetical protein LCL98_21805 [Rossellomorea aquimaris]|nr:hypothetical protein [Rossellomorea aquimaris]
MLAMLDNISNDWFSFMEDDSLWDNMLVANKDTYFLEKTNEALSEQSRQFEEYNKQLRELELPKSLPTEDLIKLGNTRAILEESIDDQTMVISSLQRYASEESESMRDTILESVDGNVRAIKLKQKRFERELNELNQKYDLEPIKYFQ